MNNDLIYVIEERNVVAHRVLDNGNLIDDVPIPENTIRFARLKNSPEALDYTQEKYIEIVNVILRLTFHFSSFSGGFSKIINEIQ